MELAKMTLENFYTATGADKDALINAFEKDVHCVVINSIIGNGATHLMMGIAKGNKEDILILNYEKLLVFNGCCAINKLNLNSIKHLFLDSWNGFYLACERNDDFLDNLEMMERKISSFINNGGKVYMTGNIDNMNGRLFSFVNRFSTTFIILDKVEKEVLGLLLRDFDETYKADFSIRFGYELLNKKYYSYREFNNELMVRYCSLTSL